MHAQSHTAPLLEVPADVPLRRGSADAINAIESTLGTNPQGPYVTVADAIDAKLDTSVGTMSGDCVRESAPPTGSAVYDTATYDSSDDFGSGGVTQYYVVNGQLRALVRDNAPFAVTSDALGSVRLVVDTSGTVVSKFDYDAWGHLLASSFDDLPGSMVYRYVGTYGCRWDADTGLTYMRQRWYDGAVTQRFVAETSYRAPIDMRTVAITRVS